MMLKLGKLTLGKRPTVCAVLQDRFTPAVLKKLKSDRIQLVELRVDQFRNLELPYIQSKIKILKKNGFAVLLTVRDRREGGSAKLNSNERFLIYKSCIKSVDAVDVELCSAICKKVTRLAKKNNKKVIVSFHDFKKTPPNQKLDAYMKRAKSANADIVKIACFAKNNNDLSRLLQFTVNFIHRSVIVIAMGSAGKVSRTLFPLCGSLITYGFAGKKSAPGQLSAGELAKFFRHS